MSVLPPMRIRVRLFAMQRETAGTKLLLLEMPIGATVEDAWAAAHVDEDWNMERWGRDELALERRAFHFAEMAAAGRVLELIR